jgi:hypothetical protein
MKIRMEKRFFAVIFALLLAIPAGIAAQGRETTLYVTQIQVESRNNLIRLTWVDSPDARGPVYIFRSARPFLGSIPANIRPVVVRYGQQYYIDDTDDMGNVHYFIAASDVSGRRYDLILPRINSTSINFGQVQEGDRLVQGAETPARELIQGVSNLRATQDGERVIITYDALGPRRNAILYRSMQPLRQPQDLLNAVIVQSGIVSGFVDFPVPGITWYYAVIFEDEIATGNMGIRPGVNATVSPVTITSQHTTERSLRPIPLPMLTLRNTMPEGFLGKTSEQRPLSMESVNMLRDIQMPSKMPMTFKSPRIFAVDMEAPTGGEESALFQIVMEHFVTFEWENARISLQYYLSLPRSRDVEARARFYLGQTLYYTERYREALMEFLSFRTLHPAEANNWIEAVLTAMVY